MSNPIKKIALKKYLNYKLKNLYKNERAYDFAFELKKVEKVLVILPPNEEYSTKMQNFIKQIGTLFPKARVSTFVTSSLRKEDMSWLNVPNEKYLKVIRDEQFDLVLDMNLKQETVASYLCALSGAPMRINLASGAYDGVYNMHFRTKQTENIDNQLKNIHAYLQHLQSAHKE